MKNNPKCFPKKIYDLFFFWSIAFQNIKSHLPRSLENLVFQNIPFSSISRQKYAITKNQPTLISALITGLNINIFPANTWPEFPHQLTDRRKHGTALGYNRPQFPSVFESSRIRQIYIYISDCSTRQWCMSVWGQTCRDAASTEPWLNQTPPFPAPDEVKHSPKFWSTASPINEIALRSATLLHYLVRTTLEFWRIVN